jgi:chorismate synthase
MPGSSFGRLFKISTFGESHGPAIGVVIDGVPPQVDLSEADIQFELDRRRPGQSSVTTPRKESDTAEILSGVFEGKTTGAPLAILIRNANQRSKDYSNIKDVFRPGHADYSFFIKYGIRDYRGGGRSSGRETACRVAAGAVAKKVLTQFGVNCFAYTQAVHSVEGSSCDRSFIEQNPVRCADRSVADAMVSIIEQARDKGDSVGGVIEAVVEGCPPGLGDPVFEKLDALLAQAVMSIGTIKGIEIGDGFASTRRFGSENNDGFSTNDDGSFTTTTNHSGGILGGISTGNVITLRAAVKPASSISKAQDTVDKDGKDVNIEVHGRHDPCICPRAVPVIESMVSLVILDALLVQKANTLTQKG